jgi:hypothetical protein
MFVQELAIQFARFRVWEAYLDSLGIRYKITHQTVIPL